MSKLATIGWVIRVVLAPALGCVVSFLAGGLFWAVVVGRGPEMYEMTDGEREQAQSLIVDFKNGKIRKRVRLDLTTDNSLDVQIVAFRRGGAYGFVRMSEPVRFWWIENRGFRVKKFDDYHLFVAMNDWYLDEFERGLMRRGVGNATKTDVREK
jgi:hypothetical protein